MKAFGQGKTAIFPGITTADSKSQYVFRGLVPGKQYWIRVAALGTRSQIAYSTIATILPNKKNVYARLLYYRYGSLAHLLISCMRNRY